jgi:hypothetical protein
VREGRGDWGRKAGRVEELYSGGAGWLDPRCESLQQCGFNPKTVSYQGSQAKTRTKHSTARTRSVGHRRAAKETELVEPPEGQSSRCPSIPRAISTLTPHAFTSSYCQPSRTPCRAPHPGPSHMYKTASIIPPRPRPTRRVWPSCVSRPLVQAFLPPATPPCPPIGRLAQLSLCLRYSVDRSRVLSLSSGDSTEKCNLPFCMRFASAQARGRC